MRGQAVAGAIVDRLVERNGARTSRSCPLRVDVVPLDGTPGLDDEGAAGRLGITFLPGKKRDGWTGPHGRDLDLARLREDGWDALCLLNEDRELERCLVPEIEAVFGDAGTQVLVTNPERTG